MGEWVDGRGAKDYLPLIGTDASRLRGNGVTGKEQTNPGNCNKCKHRITTKMGHVKSSCMKKEDN